MTLDRGDRLAVAGTSRPEAGAPPDAPAPGAPTPGVLATDALLARVGGDRALLGAMAALFLDECPAFLADIRRALDGRDAAALERAAHALRGAVSNFAADDVALAALALESMGRDGNLTKSDQAFRALEAELERLRPALEELR